MKFVGPRPSGSEELATLAVGRVADPVLTYVDGRLSSIVYGDGSVKTFTYTANRLTQVDHVVGSTTTRTTFTYTSENLTSSVTVVL